MPRRIATGSNDRCVMNRQPWIWLLSAAVGLGSLAVPRQHCQAGYNVQTAVDYANYWCNKRNPAYPDYSNSGGDCANFVSQCLIAGGFLPGPNTYPSVWGLIGQLEARGAYQIASSQLQAGDVLAADLRSGHEHIVFIVSGSGTGAKFAGHSNDRCGSTAYGFARCYRIPGGSGGGTLNSQWVGQSYPQTMLPNEQVYAWIEYQNTGTVGWDQGGDHPVNLGTWNPTDRASAFCSTWDWLNCARPSSMDQSHTDPGHVARWTFVLTAPSEPGYYVEYFRLVSEGTAWFGDEGVWFGITVTDPGYCSVSGPSPDMAVCPGNSASFTVLASGTCWNLQWFGPGGTYLTNGGHYDGVNTPHLTINNVDASVTGEYLLEACDFYGCQYTPTSVLSLLTPTTITQQPTAQSVCPGQIATFTVASSGEGIVFHQWQRNQVDILNGGKFQGADSATLTVSNADASVAGVYRCVVSANCGSTTSQEAGLTLRTATAITQQPAPMTVCPGQSAAFLVAATGDGNLVYQWQLNGANVLNGGHFAGADTASLTVSNTDQTVVGEYRCLVTSGCGSVLSEPASLATLVSISVSGNELDQVICEGQTANFSVTVADNQQVSYRWQKDGIDLDDGGGIAGSATSSLQIASASMSDAGVYRCRLTSLCNTVFSAASEASVVVATQVTQQPQAVTVRPGGVALMSTAAQGGFLAFQWSKDGVPLVNDGRHFGVQTAVLTILESDQSDVGSYTCTVSGSCGSETTQPVSLNLGSSTPGSNVPRYQWAPRAVVGGGGSSTATDYHLASSEAQNGGVGPINSEAYGLDDGFWSGARAIPVLVIAPDLDSDGDVDADDLPHLSQCMTGEMLGPPSLDCLDADLDRDNDVDMDDYGLFQACMSGTDIPSDPACWTGPND